MNAANEALRIATAETLASDFERSFAIEMADAPERRERVFQVRHQVFCQELGFNMSNDGSQEADDYDAHSLHILLRHRPSGLDTGCMRVVLPRPHIGGGLPMESFGVEHIDRSKLDWDSIDPKNRCEISRLAVVSDFRRLIGDQLHPDSDAGNDNPSATGANRRFPFIVLSLYHAALSLTLNAPYEHIFMTIEPRLARHIRRYGFNLEQISGEFDYYGPRAVFYTTQQRVTAELQRWKAEWQGLFNNVHWQLFGRKSEHVHAI